MPKNWGRAYWLAYPVLPISWTLWYLYTVSHVHPWGCLLSHVFIYFNWSYLYTCAWPQKLRLSKSEFLWRYTVESYWESYTTCWSVRDQDQNYWLTELVRHHLIVVIDVLDRLSHCGLKVISLAPSPATAASLGAGSSMQGACVICSRYLQAHSKHFQVGQVRKLVWQLLTIHRFGSGCGWLGFVGTTVLSTFIQPWWWWSIDRCLPSSLGFSLVFKLSLTCLL